MIACLEIMADIQADKSTYKIIVDGFAGVRLVVERYDDEFDSKPTAFQGVDLTPEECAVLGAHLTAMAGIKHG